MRFVLLAGGIILGLGLLHAGSQPKPSGSRAEYVSVALSLLGATILAIAVERAT